MDRRTAISILCVVLLIGCRMISFVTTPLWIDFFKDRNATNATNVSLPGDAIFSANDEYATWYDPGLKLEFFRPYDVSDLKKGVRSEGRSEDLNNEDQNNQDRNNEDQNNDDLNNEGRNNEDQNNEDRNIKDQKNRNRNNEDRSNVQNHNNLNFEDSTTSLDPDSDQFWDVLEKNGSRIPEAEDTFPFFIALIQAVVPFLFWSSVLVAIRICFPHQITEFERSYPTKFLVIPGFAQALSTMLVIHAQSGTRTALYLQAIINNFNIPIQFIARLVLLRKWPTLRKAVCAGVVVLAEFLCLLPSIVPSLETDAQRKNNGGASGAGAILWPLCFVSSMIPYVVANSIMEKGVKDSVQSEANQSPNQSPPRSDILVYSSNVQVSHVARTELHGDDFGTADYSTPTSTADYNTQAGTADYNTRAGTAAFSTRNLHMAYYLSWYCACLSLGIMGLFWMDLIPGFGTSSSIQEFGQKMSFNLRCIVGAEDKCGPEVAILGWTTTLANFGGFSVMPYLLRYSEGANFMIVAQALRSPLLFLFWTLFKEPPFRWYPHVSLSTWLSIASLFLMVPAVIVYNIGAPEHVGKKYARPESTQPLLESTGESSDS